MNDVQEEDDDELSREKFEATWRKLMTTKRDKYQFIFGAGPSLKDALFNLYSTIWKTKKCPSLWEKTSLLPIYKYGPVENLSNYRNIHIKSDFGKMFGHLVVSEAREKSIENMSVLQTAKP